MNVCIIESKNKKISEGVPILKLHRICTRIHLVAIFETKKNPCISVHAVFMYMQGKKLRKEKKTIHLP